MAAIAERFPEAERLEKAPSTDVRRRWTELQVRVRTSKRVAITNHEVVEAVLLAPDEYESLVARARASDEMQLAHYTERFQQRLACLQETDARDRIQRVLAKRGNLAKPIPSGDSY